MGQLSDDIKLSNSTVNENQTISSSSINNQKWSWYTFTPLLQIFLLFVGFYLGIGLSWDGNTSIATTVFKIAFGLICLLGFFPIITFSRSKFNLKNFIVVLLNIIIPVGVVYIYFKYYYNFI